MSLSQATIHWWVLASGPDRHSRSPCEYSNLLLFLFFPILTSLSQPYSNPYHLFQTNGLLESLLWSDQTRTAASQSLGGESKLPCEYLNFLFSLSDTL